jgi:hypothetical protein
VSNLEGKDWIAVALVAALVGGGVGFVTGKTVAKASVLQAIRDDGIDAATFRLVNEEGVERMTLWLPTELEASVSGMGTPYPVLRLHEVDGTAVADVPITPGAVRRAGGF